MNGIWKTSALAVLLSACAGQAAGGQTDPGDLTRLNAYEIPNEQVDAMAQQEVGPGWIQVNGTGSVPVSPDRARLSFAMETRATAAGDAAGANADAMDAVLRALRGAGFTGLELETFGYTLRPEYSVTNDRQTREIIAYTAVNNVGATLEDVDAVGRVIDVAIGAGANRVSGISFYAADTEEARREALALAVQSARAEAAIMAESLGYTLGAPLEVNGGAQRPIPRPMAAEAMVSMRAADTPIEVGDQTVTASVSIRFALGPEAGG